MEAWGHPTFRVKRKIFVGYTSSSGDDEEGRPGAWMKSAAVTQDLLVRAEPSRYFVPPYVGKSGWVGAYLDGRPDWDVVADLVRDAWRLTAPKKLLASLPSGEPAKQRR